MFLYSAITVLHVIVCIILVLVVLLQSGKGADLAGAFGGGATQTAFGSRGPASFLSKMTTIAAVVFMLTSIGLSMISTQRGSQSVLEGAIEETTAPASEKAKSDASDTSNFTPEQIEKMYEQELKAKSQGDTSSEDSAPEPEQQAP
jgi:preprotein translocase subunit SecG